MPYPLISQSSKRLEGSVPVPGDKSISHRALMFASLAVGESRIRGLLTGEDVRATASAMRAMGAEIIEGADEWRVFGVGVGGLAEPDDVLDMGKSGTSARLIMGLIASHGINATLTGDESLRQRPMQRVITPLEQIGARFHGKGGGRLPLTLEGAIEPLPIHYASPVASAQVKSAVLLAGLNTPGITSVLEPVATRDHSERMLSSMGAVVNSETRADGHFVSIHGHPELQPIDLDVPGDISSAAFLLVAASLIDGSDVTLQNVGLNPLRTGIIEALRAMGADITITGERTLGGEPAGNIRVRGTTLQPLPDGVPCHESRMIDEFPVLFIAAACTPGTSRFRGLKELRVKESDRIALMAEGLAACGVQLTEVEDGIEIEGSDTVKGGATIRTALDHRIAMSFAILGLCTDAPVTIDDASPINTSFPGFVDLMKSLGAQIDSRDPK